MKRHIVYKILIKIPLFFILLSVSTSLMSAKDYPPIPYNAYNGPSIGGRAMAMGFAYSPVGGDPSTIVYNPAGLSDSGRDMISFTYEAARQSSLAYSQMFFSDTLKHHSLQFIALVSDKSAFSWRPMANTTVTENDGTNWKESEVKIDEYTVSAYHKSENGLKTGINISYLTGRIGQAGIENGVPSTNLSDGRGMSMDLGFMIPLSGQIMLGLSFENLLGNMWWDDYEKEQLPFGLRGGFAFKISEQTLFAHELEKKYYRNENPGPDETIRHYGIEQGFGGAVKLRFGMYGSDLNDMDTVHMTSGLGYEKENYILSLAADKYKVTGFEVSKYVFSFDIPIK
ncbi:hypothetical protein ACFL58_02915 [Elusimicrobiota bacterium]